MKYTIEDLPNEPINIWTPYEEWDWKDTKESDARLNALWGASTEPVYHIANILHSKFSMEDLMAISANVAYGQGSLWTHPNLKMVILVSQDPLILKAIANVAESLKKGKGVYMQVPFIGMDSLDKALAYARQEIRNQKASGK
jgi:hypothetical protein